MPVPRNDYSSRNDKEHHGRRREAPLSLTGSWREATEGIQRLYSENQTVLKDTPAGRSLGFEFSSNGNAVTGFPQSPVYALVTAPLLRKGSLSSSTIFLFSFPPGWSLQGTGKISSLRVRCLQSFNVNKLLRWNNKHKKK